MHWYGIADERFSRTSRYSVTSSIYRYGLVYAAMVMFQKPEVVVGFSALRRVLDYFVVRAIVGPLPKGGWLPTFKLSEMKGMLSTSAPLTIAQVCVTSLSALPAVAISRSLGLESLGAYRAIFDLSNRIWFVSNGMGVVVFPKLVKMFSAGLIEERRRSQLRAAFYFSWVGYLVFALAAVIMGTLVLDLLGLDSEQYGALWGLVIIGVCMSAHSQLGYEVLQASRRFAVLLLSTAGALILMAGMSFQVSFLGVLAVGYAWVISQVFYTTCLDFFSLRVSGVDREDQRQFLAAKALYMVVPIAYVVVMAMGRGFGLGVFGLTLVFVALLQFYSIKYYRLLSVGSS